MTSQISATMEKTMTGTSELKSPVVMVNTTASTVTTIPSKEMLIPAIKQYRKIVKICMALTTCILLYGYDLVIVGNIASMPQFQRDFGQRFENKYIISAMWLAVWLAATPIGIMFGAASGGFLQDRIGRRYSLVLGSTISAIAVAGCYVSYLPADIDTRRGVFLAAKMVQGIAIGMVICTTQTYMSEILPPGLRAPVMALFPIFTLLGQLVGAIVVYILLSRPDKTAYTICFASQWPFSAAPFIVALWIPESAVYLVHKNRFSEALKSIKRFHAADLDHDKILDDLRLSIELEQQTASTKPRYADCFKGSNLRRTLLVIWANLLPHLFGLTLLAKASYFMQIVGMSPSNSIIFLILGIGLGMFANLGSTWTMTRFGRRPLAIYTLIIIGLLWLSMGIANCFKTNYVTIWWTAISMMVITIILGLGVWPVSYTVGAETSSLHLRAKTQGIGWFIGGLFSGVFSIILPYIFNPDEGNLRGRTGFMFFGFCTLAAVVSWLYLPEMKGREAAELDVMFELGIPARKFKEWKAESRVENDGNA